MNPIKNSPAKENSHKTLSAKTAHHILIIEDDPIMQEILIQRFGLAGINITAAGDGEKGLALIKKEEKPDLILLDLLLPGKDGFSVLEEIKKDPATQNIPVIILSNLAQKNEIERGLALGAIEFLIKTNYTPTEILHEVEKILDQQ